MKARIFCFFMSLFIIGISCNDKEFLEEIPVGIYTSNIAYNEPNDIVATITELYYQIKKVYDGAYRNLYYYIGTDVAMDPRNPSQQLGYVTGGSVTPDNPGIAFMWNVMYQVIKNANLILDQVVEIEYNNEELKNQHIAEARFFRGLAYRNLAIVYGRAPIVLEVIEEPKRNYELADKEIVYKQALEDLKFATEFLPDINKVDGPGRVSKAAAYHYLSEVYISLKDYDNAIKSAKWVIENPNFHLMTERFGRRTDVPNTNVFWDLFQRGNVDWQDGNKETIWALQTAYGIPGGGNLTWHADGNFKFERTCGPNYMNIADPDGVRAFLGPTTWNGGRPQGYVSPVNHVKYDIWKDNFDNDIRNAACNIKRDYIVDNPSSAYFGQSTDDFKELTDTIWLNYPSWLKTSTPGDHLPELIADEETGELWASGGGTHRNWQLIRLSETYLLLAEAYLGKGDLENAALNINVVRERANASLVSIDDVNIDFILDERIRELMYEEPRRLTLMRLGKWYERTIKYNPWSSEDKIEKHWEVFPIPFSEIERNTEAELEQNPGYTN